MLQNLNNFTSLVIKLIVITAIVLAVGYFGISIWGNISLSRDNTPDMPSVASAPYEIHIATTGQTMLTKEYVIIRANKPAAYDLDNYYMLKNNKWVLIESKLTLDEYYWGDITIQRRVD